MIKVKYLDRDTGFEAETLFNVETKFEAVKKFNAMFDNCKVIGTMVV